MENNTKLSQQMTGLYATMHKWEGILAGYKVFALANDGVVDAEEKAQIDRLQGEIDAIKARIVQISSKKGIVLEQVGISTTPPSSQETIAADGPMGLPEDVGGKEFGSIISGILGQYTAAIAGLFIDEKTGISGNLKLDAANVSKLTNLFSQSAAHPFVNKIKTTIESVIKANSGTSMETVNSALIAEFNKLTPAKLQAEFFSNAQYGGKKVSETTLRSYLPKPDEVALAFKALADKTDDNHPINNPNTPQQFAAEYAAWRNEMLKELNQWTPIFGQCTLSDDIVFFYDLFGGIFVLQIEILKELKATLPSNINHYHEISNTLKNLLEQKLNAAWSEKLFHKDETFSMPKPSLVMGKLNSCVSKEDFLACADTSILLNIVDDQANYNEFLSAFETFLKDLSNNVLKSKVENPNASPDAAIIDSQLLFSHLNDISKIASGAPTILSLTAFMKAGITKKYTTVAACKKLVEIWSQDKNVHKKTTWFAQQYFLWVDNYQSSGTFPNESGVTNAIHSAYVDVDADQLRAKLVAWSSSVKSVLTQYPQRCLNQKRLLAQLGNLFVIGDKLGQDTMFIYDLIKKNMESASIKYIDPEQTNFSQAEFERCIWIDSLNALIDTAFVSNVFNVSLEKHGPYAIKNFVEDSSFRLPNATLIEQAFRMSVCDHKEVIIPEMANAPIQHPLFLEFKGKNNILIGGLLSIPTRYEHKKMMVGKELSDVLFVVPEKNGISWIHTKSDIPSGNSELIYIKVMTPIIDDANKKATTLVKLQYRVTYDFREFAGFFNLDETKIYNDDKTQSVNWGEFISNIDISIGPLSFSTQNLTSSTPITLIVSVEYVLESELKSKSIQSVSGFAKSTTLNWNVRLERSGPSLFTPELKYK